MYIYNIGCKSYTQYIHYMIFIVSLADVEV